MSREERCTFFGHRDFGKLEYSDYIEEIFEYLILNKEVSEFLSGGMGNFDRICEGIVRKLKKKYSHIKLKLVLAYSEEISFRIVKRDIGLYDEIVIPNLGKSDSKENIYRRNFYMADNSGFLVSGVYKKEGGAVKAVEHAREDKNVRIINIFKKKI